MDPQIPTSFIPKRPVVANDSSSYENKARKPLGLMSLIAIVVLLATLLSSAGIFLFEKQLISRKEMKEQRKAEAEKDLGGDFIARMKVFDNRIVSIKTLIQNHIVVTPIFKALQEFTLRSVQYNNFSYLIVTNSSKQDMVRVLMKGSAKSYETIALQSDEFAKSKIIKDAVFSGLTLEEKKGVINFDLTFNVDMKDVSYQSFIDSLQNPLPGQGVQNI